MLAASGMLALGLAFAAAPPDPFAAEPPEPVRDLARGARAADALPLQIEGRLRIENVRERLGALAALSQAALPALRGGDLRARLFAHALVAGSQEAMASALGKAPTPEAARGAARDAWHEQVEAALSRALIAAAAHWRSCRDLAREAPEAAPFAQACAARLGRLPAALGGGSPEAPPGDGAALARERAGELRPCLDASGAGAGHPAEVELTARLALDARGRVEEVALAPAPGDRGLADCLRAGLSIWVFPGLSEVELEVPLRLTGR